MAITTIPKPTPEQAKRRLWWLHYDPERLTDNQRESLETLTDPLLCLARDTIRQGKAAVLSANDPLVITALDDVFMNGRPPAPIIERHAARLKANGLELADGMWPNKQAVMVISFSHFTGDYPGGHKDKTCKTNWIISGRGHKVEKAAPVEFSLWRGYTTRGGEWVAPCEHCRHERVLSFCKKLEKASDIYRRENMMRYAVMSEKEAKQTADKIRKRNQRKEGHIFYTTFPLQNSTVILHDAHDIDGTPLPGDRAALYDLVTGWVLNTPKGKRAGHGLSTWGTLPADIARGTAVKDTQESKKNEATGGADDDEGSHGRWRLIGPNYGRLARTLEAHLDQRIPAKGAKVDLDLSELLDLFEKAGIDYAVFDGELPGDVTLNVCESKISSTKWDKPGKTAVSQPAAPLPQSHFEAVFGGAA